jgi:hypothetical protein
VQPFVPRAAAALAAAALLSGSAPGQPRGNALDLLDAYLWEAAATTPAYRADLRAGAGPSDAADGRRAGVSPVLGPFTYRPRTFPELSASERSGVLADPALGNFLRKRRAAALRLAIPPAEMLRPGPLVVAVPEP